MAGIAWKYYTVVQGRIGDRDYSYFEARCVTRVLGGTLPVETWQVRKELALDLDWVDLTEAIQKLTDAGENLEDAILESEVDNDSGNSIIHTSVSGWAKATADEVEQVKAYYAQIAQEQNDREGKSAEAEKETLRSLAAKYPELAAEYAAPVTRERGDDQERLEAIYGGPENIANLRLLTREEIAAALKEQTTRIRNNPTPQEARVKKAQDAHMAKTEADYRARGYNQI